MDKMEIRATCDRMSCTYPSCTCFQEGGSRCPAGEGLREAGVANESGISPRGRAVLVQYYEPERKNSLIVVPDNVQDRVNQIEQRAQVLEVGPSCWPDEAPRAKPGDYVLISKMAGYAFRGPKDGKSYRLVNDRDIFAQLTYLGEPK